MSEKNEIVVYQPENEEFHIDVCVENETVWLTQAQIAKLFGTQRPAITKHLANIYASQELEENSTCSVLEHVGNEGKQNYSTKYYNLDVILAIGYRVNSKNATLFRRWATQVLKDHLLKGYSINQRLMLHSHVRREGVTMYKTATGVATDAQAAEIDALNEEIWKNFWEIPREKRTKADWEKLFNIQILVRKD